MTHLTRDEMVAWRDAPAETNRARIVEHLAVCDRCAAVHAELIRTRAADAPPAHFDPAAFVGRGYAAGTPARRSFLTFGPRAFVPLAVAAALILAVWLPSRREPPQEAVIPTGAVRGARPQAIAPTGQTSGPIEFRWASPVSADRFAVEVKDETGQRVFYREARDERLAGDAALEAALRPGVPYTWTITALDAAGEVISRSAPAPFTWSPAPSR